MIEFKKDVSDIFIFDGDSVRIKREAIAELKKPVIDKENYVRKAIYTKEEAIKRHNERSLRYYYERKAKEMK
ncbi:hypothetical protein M0R04_11045 [Candidatus Dojkabacteria bacterium]|nr:hypothetical protein [Candidatus Dojkabacteria bacterium]